MIDSVSATSTTSASQAMKQEIGMDKDDFLKLFVAQLQNQDPLNPMDGTQFVTQLAQMTQVEQSYNTNTNLQNILSSLSDNTYMSSVSFIGKTVTAPGSQISLADGSEPNLNYTMARAANQVEIDISDSNGNVVRTMTQGQTAAGNQNIAWDGKDANNNALPAGTYTFAVKGIDANGNSFGGTPMIKGTVTGVKLDGSVPVLTVNGTDVQLSRVSAVEGVS
jgi:flagellar basal-body rod modification protein FlgD